MSVTLFHAMSFDIAETCGHDAVFADKWHFLENLQVKLSTSRDVFKVCFVYKNYQFGFYFCGDLVKKILR